MPGKGKKIFSSHLTVLAAVLVGSPRHKCKAVQDVRPETPAEKSFIQNHQEEANTESDDLQASQQPWRNNTGKWKLQLKL